MLNSIITTLAAFGIVPANSPFLVLAILIIAGVIYIRISLGKPLSKMKDNVLVVIAHLTSSRAKLNPALIKEMSPLQIQPEGEQVLKESGFIELFPVIKTNLFSIIDDRKPASKLEVETYSIFSFLQIMSQDSTLISIKSYLYQHPTVRDTFPTLAGVYIRDQYLSEHSDITQ